MHLRWALFIQWVSFFIKHKMGKVNHVANSFSRRVEIFIMLHTKVSRFEKLKELYIEYSFFAEI